MYDANCKPGDRRDFGGHMYFLRPDRIWESCKEFYVDENEFVTSLKYSFFIGFIGRGEFKYPKFLLEGDTPNVKDAITISKIVRSMDGKLLVINDHSSMFL